MTGHKYVGLTEAQAAALFSIVTTVLNDPTWPYQPGQARALAGAQSALAKVIKR